MAGGGLTVRRLKVLAVIPGDGAGNSMIFARRQVSSLQRCGIAVDTVFLPDRSASGLLKSLRRLRDAVREFEPDIVHAHYGTVTSLLCAAATSRPLVITFRGSDLNRDPAVGICRFVASHVMSQLSTLRAKRVLCVSEQLRRKLWFCSADVVPTGVDVTRFAPRAQQACRAKLDWPAEQPVILFSSGTAPVAKGMPLVAAAVEIVRKQIPGVRLVVLDGSTLPDDVALYLNAADCLAFASEREGSPNIVKEALACNLPIVAVDVGDVRERLRHVAPSFVVARDVHDFSDALVKVLCRRGRSNGRSELGALTEVSVALTIQRIYAEVIGTPDAVLQPSNREVDHQPAPTFSAWWRRSA